MNAKKHFTVLLCLLMLCPLFVQAQANYKPGLVITLAGDTLRGFINYKEWHQTPTSFSFRPSAESKAEQLFDVTNARYFEITGMEAFQRYEGPVTLNPVDLNVLPDSYNTEVAEVRVFLKIHQKGQNVHLLSYTDQIKTRYFYQENDGSPPQELYYYRHHASGNRNTQIVTLKGFIGQLNYLASSYGMALPIFTRDIEKSEYQGQDLEKIIGLLNGNTQAALADRKKSNGSARLFAGIALSRNTANIRGDHKLSESDKNSAGISPRITVGADIFANRHVQKLLLRMEASAALTKYTIEKEERFIGSGYRNHTYTIAQQTASLHPQVIYNLYNTDNFKAYTGLGALINYSLTTDNTYTTQYFSPMFSQTYEPIVKEDYLDLMSFWISFSARAGLLVNRKYEFYATYMPPIHVTRYVDFSLRLGSISLGVNYLFSKK